MDSHPAGIRLTRVFNVVVQVMFEVEYTELLKKSSSSMGVFLCNWQHDIQGITFPLTVVSQHMSSLYPHLFLLSPCEMRAL